MFEHLLVPTDGSDPATHALDLAIGLAKTCGARLSLIHIVDRGSSIAALRDIAERYGFLAEVADDLSDPAIIVPIAAPGAAAPVIVLPDTLLERFGRLLLDASGERARERGLSDVSTALLEGDPAEETLRYAEQNTVDLIVPGSRGLGEVRSLLLGSVSHKLIADGGCPCLVVK